MQSLHVFLSKLNDRCDSFWQWPNMKLEGWSWYAYGAVCINTLADMMVICLHKTLPVGHRLHIVVRQWDSSRARYQNGSSLASYAVDPSHSRATQLRKTLHHVRRALTYSLNPWVHLNSECMVIKSNDEGEILKWLSIFLTKFWYQWKAQAWIQRIQTFDSRHQGVISSQATGDIQSF